MNFEYFPHRVVMRGNEDFDAEKIFTCGQCFRWHHQQDGSWLGVALGHALRVEQKGDEVTFFTTPDEFSRLWYDYFDLGRDYAAIRESVAIDDYMRAACDYGRGIRILNQDRWEALCSFIFSQCNNIPRISAIVERLCQTAGERVEYMGGVYYTFPSPEKVLAMTADELSALRSGYRAPYVTAAAGEIVNGRLDLDALGAADPVAAMKALTALNGVGVKVASCAMLFSLRIPEAFPVDTWMKQAIKAHYPDGLDPKVFGQYAGVAQQYMFYHIRSGAG